jgi:3,4-dihydroxyphenylacetate 2,3-dioxygenase
MGEIIGAGLVSHVPTMMLPLDIRMELNEGKDISLIDGLKRLRTEVLDVLKPDTIIIFDTHFATLLEVVVATHARRTGKYTSDELPRGMSQIPYDLIGDPELGERITVEATLAGTRSTPIDDPYLPIHYGTLNVAKYLQGDERWLTVSLCQSADTDDFLKFGQGLARAIAALDRRVVLLASGSMSHRFWPLKELPLHEASDPIHIRTPEARAADMERLAWFEEGRHDKVIETMPAFLAHAPEGRFGHYLMMAGALGGEACKAKGRLFSEYENATGTSQVHVWFDRPEGGWTAG